MECLAAKLLESNVADATTKEEDSDEEQLESEINFPRESDTKIPGKVAKAPHIST